jgi:hypothetical protein
LLIVNPASSNVSFAIVELRSKFPADTTGKLPMKTLTVGAMVLALAVAPAYAQARRPHDDGKKAEQKKPQVDEKAYNEALKRIPEPKEKYDPWSGARPDKPAK